MMSLRMSKICKSFGPTFALKDLTLTVHPGERLGLLGPQGAGKSTLLRIMAGQILPEFGTVTYGEKPCRAAIISGTSPLPPQKTCRQILARPLRQRDLNWLQRVPGFGAALAPDRMINIAGKVQSTAARIGLDPLLETRAGELSPGDRLRLRIGQALVCGPDALLLDEPLEDLAAELRPAMLAELALLQRNLGLIFIYATRNEAEARAFSQRLVALKDGRLLQSGPPDALHDDPDTLEVARLLGQPPICLLPGTLDATGRLTILGHGVGRFRVKAPVPVQVGLRPDAVSVTESGAGLFKGIVVDHQRIGFDLFLHIDLAAGGQRVIAKAPHDPRAWPPVDREVTLNVDIRGVLLFERDGTRLRLPELQTHRAIA